VHWRRLISSGGRHLDGMTAKTWDESGMKVWDSMGLARSATEIHGGIG